MAEDEKLAADKVAESTDFRLAMSLLVFLRFAMGCFHMSMNISG